MFRAMGCGAAAMTIAIAMSAPATAQGVCDNGRKLFEERASIIQRINGWGKKQVNPNTACATFTSLQKNGEALAKFMTENQAWCRIPQDAVEGVQQQQKQVQATRAQACKVAADVAKAQREAAKAAESGGNSAFAGPDDVTGGARRVPQGAL